MVLSFADYLVKRDYEAEELIEKQIIYGNNAKYGQIVFIAGGAGSGKGFAIKNFMNGDMFKVRDVDELKLAFQKLDNLGKFTIQDLMDKYGNKMSETDRSIIQSNIIDKGITMKDLNLKNPQHVFSLHILVKATGAKDKTLDLLLDRKNEAVLPNIIFDTTLADLGDIEAYVPKLLEVGYKAKDIHITWVLTNYEIAIKNNKSRARVVPDDILLKTHKGAAGTIFNMVRSGMPKDVDGGLYVILNNPENTVFVVDPKTGEHYKTASGKKVVSSFTYITLKKPGSGIVNTKDVQDQLYSWIRDNVPQNAIDDSLLNAR